MTATGEILSKIENKLGRECEIEVTVVVYQTQENDYVYEGGESNLINSNAKMNGSPVELSDIRAQVAEVNPLVLNLFERKIDEESKVQGGYITTKRAKDFFKNQSRDRKMVLKTVAIVGQSRIGKSSFQSQLFEGVNFKTDKDLNMPCT